MESLRMMSDDIGPPADDAATIKRSWDDPEWFAAIFDCYFGEVHRYLARRVGPVDADDLAAEAFSVAFTERRRYDVSRACARPWLYGIATNLIASHRRRERRFLHAIARSAPPGHPSSGYGDEERLVDRVSAAAVRPILAAALMALPTGDRDVVLLIALGDLGYTEVAEALGIPYGTVCSRLNRARRRLRESLGGTNPIGVPEPTASA
jgi:RNA polymerase sigma factor (sigma-70 family)